MLGDISLPYTKNTGENCLLSLYLPPPLNSKKRSHEESQPNTSDTHENTLVDFKCTRQGACCRGLKLCTHPCSSEWMLGYLERSACLCFAVSKSESVDYLDERNNVFVPRHEETPAFQRME